MKKTNILTLTILFILVSCLNIKADILPEYKQNKKESNTNQILTKSYTSVFDVQKNTVSNIDFYTSNYGIFGLDIAHNTGGGFWPRGSTNQYIFGGGIWIGAKKVRPGSTDPNDLKKYVEVSYNPNSGKSWFVPGSINDGDLVDQTDIYRYRTFFSVDFRTDGTPLSVNDKGNWPIWDDSQNDTLKQNRYFGHFIYDSTTRYKSIFPKGPAFISGEDIFATYKDTDLNFFEPGAGKMKSEGYPLRLQVEQTIYSWGFGDYRDFIFLSFNIINKSSDILQEVWVAPVMDIDIAAYPNYSLGATNDRVRFYDKEDTLNLAAQWSNSDRGEANQGFGYLGFDFLESPAIDSSRYIRHDKRVFLNSEQIGLVTFRNWPISEDKIEAEDRYNFMSAAVKDGDTGPGDKRLLMATGPFNMKPNDTARVVVGMVLAVPTKGANADGSYEDMQELVFKDKFAQEVYDNNFRTPTPPDRSIIYRQNGYNHAVAIQWDSTAELSKDVYEKGLDFMGLKIYRARRVDLDTFDVNNIKGGGLYPGGKGPFGWKLISQYQIPTPFFKSVNKAGTDPNNALMPYIDSLRIVGPVMNSVGKILDSLALRVVRIPRGISIANLLTSDGNILTATPFIVGIDTSLYSKPWGPYYYKLLKESGVDIPTMQILPDVGTNNKLIDSVMLGVVHLKKAFMPYNRIFYKENTISIDPNYIKNLMFKDGMVGQWHVEENFGKLDTVRTSIDTVYQLSTLRKSTLSSTGYIIDILTYDNLNSTLKDTIKYQIVLEELYKYIQNGWVTIDFPDFEQSDAAQKEVIIPYVKELTNNRTFTDIGDDKVVDGYIQVDADPTKSEQLVNNIDYYYKILAFDEGDYVQRTPSKVNDAFIGLPNITSVKPSANTVSEEPIFETIISPEDSLKLGGLFNFKMYAIDRDRALQNFAGHDLELTFNPYWNQYAFNFQGRTDTIKFGLYQRRAVLKDLTTDKVLYDGLMNFEIVPCSGEFRGLFTENSCSYVVSDTVITDTVTNEQITFGLKYNRDIITRSGSFMSGDFRDPGYCYALATLPPAYGTIGFSYDFTMQQWGGRYRPDSITITTAKPEGMDVSTPVTFIDDTGPISNTDNIMSTQPVGLDFDSYLPGYGSFNNGPGIYEVEFLPGGTDTLDVVWGANPPDYSFNNKFIVNYLNVKVKNTLTYKRPVVLDAYDSVVVNGITNLEPMYLPIGTGDNYGYSNYNTVIKNMFPQRYYPDPRNLGYQGVDRLNPKTNQFIGKYNIGVYGWVNMRHVTEIKLQKQAARPNYEPFISSANDGGAKFYMDRQNRYYLSGYSIDGKDTLDFTHILNIGGIQFALDYANSGRMFNTGPKWQRTQNYVYGNDFKPGDKITLRTLGGALGMPMPDAKVIFRLNNPKGNNGTYTDQLLQNVQVVPNPYFIAHEGTRSPYDSKIYFTKLPKKCTINIYTIAGDLVRTINHDETTSSMKDSEFMEVWDLLTTNGIRVQSQAFVALITSADGAQAVRNFSVVVGGFRLIPQE
ncbi:MAG TPA: hypothetical protein PLC04_04245 [Candidatus Kapabacteria bacterium]|nr:hypothetical protein [Candidatus Kapabacteria bacterium]HOV92274.1 hypothetical protein [Candidatus Kapabacteria bacterium]